MRTSRRALLGTGSAIATTLLTGCSALTGSGGISGEDSDQDGVPDSKDDFPSQFEKSKFISNFREAGKGTQTVEVDPPPGASISVKISLGFKGGSRVRTTVFEREAYTKSDKRPQPTFERTIDATKGMGGKDDLDIPPNKIPKKPALIIFEPESGDVKIEVKGVVFK